ncbi:TRAP transporter large permease [Starkeya sp. ORNL1]|uniref:TRAP transporter large permease n=1 Tax=Starkeya sp. ORNL1 TaxID=2709380 RepID=UPI001462FFA1|nr:TRAP transporter large permease [Starkeya sp. ORNL1]QJP16325.1 TRAP transporter large permease [Starkeya sp. ORNL1]
MVGAALGISFLVMLLILGVPMVAALVGSVAVGLFLGGQWALVMPQSIINGMSDYTLLSLPLFVLAGVIMNVGGLSTRLFDFAHSLVGWMRGGLAQVDVLTSIFLGGMFGSSTADIAGTGSITIPAMKKAGYKADFAAATCAASSGVGPMIPPSSPMILYSAVTGTSLGALFMAGIIPGILMGLVFMGVVFVLARTRNFPRHGDLSLPEIWATFKSAFFSIGMPAIIVGGTTIGVFTPTEGGAFGVVYAIAVSMLVYRSMGVRDVYRATLAAVQLSGELLLMVGLSGALGVSLASAHVPEALAQMIDAITIGDSMFMRLVALMILAIIAGMFLDPLIPVLVPVILPTLLAFQIDLVHFGVLMVMAVVIGQLHPPIGIALIISGRIAGVDQVQVFKANIPYFIAIILFTLLLMAVPELSTWLPNYMKD